MIQMRFPGFWGLIALSVFADWAAADHCASMRRWLAQVSADPDWVEITRWSDLVVDLRYATTRNASGMDLYCGEKRAFLHRLAAGKLWLSIQWLKQHAPHWRLVIWDAARPLYAQEELRARVRGTPFSAYVSSPRPGSLHNYGMAVDVTLADSAGRPLDLGTDFDHFGILSSASEAVEDSLRALGELTEAQIKNRRQLRRAMRAGGWIPLPAEWWHYNAAPADQVRDSLKFGRPR